MNITPRLATTLQHFFICHLIFKYPAVGERAAPALSECWKPSRSQLAVEAEDLVVRPSGGTVSVISDWVSCSDALNPPVISGSCQLERAAEMPL